MKPSSAHPQNPMKRFRELALKEANGTITPHELEKLERYGALMSPPLTPGERAAMAEVEWKFRVFSKMLGKLEKTP